MADERAAYSDSLCRSDQLSCTKYFHPSYGLFYINFQSFIVFLFLVLFYFDLIRIDQVNLTSQKGMCGPHVIDYFPKQINKPNLSK